eukprot:CAMPEP_0174927214 /NCGR_PEP_ID=MMETSP1355-20121228/18015_1 /TAXON_ID=464990 /ORGANISM="Hemiselmis tepida, Strain CCMP443" /LENGTH=71 /DNA_ID=CAMNT_0016173303 /DNA_START=16 /DNA_END=227 /DNA_ORIENTATION=-
MRILRLFKLADPCWSEACLDGQTNWADCAPGDDICIASDGTAMGDKVEGYGEWVPRDNGIGHWEREGVMAP